MQVMPVVIGSTADAFVAETKPLPIIVSPVAQ
jgi:hypothetical protein